MMVGCIGIGSACIGRVNEKHKKVLARPNALNPWLFIEVELGVRGKSRGQRGLREKGLNVLSASSFGGQNPAADREKSEAIGKAVLL